ncbi:MAG: helix-turn-helix transcriptional regulator [Rhodothalassiaceae bacterium]
MKDSTISDSEARERLDHLIRTTPGASYASVSALIGRNHAYIQQYIRRGRPRRLNEVDRRRIACHFSVPESELGAPPPDPRAGPAERPGAVPDLVLVPCLGTARATSGGMQEAACEATRPFDAGQLAGLTENGAQALVVCRVHGDSMEPTLSDGDEVLVDTSETTARRDAIFAIRHAGVLQIKRLSVNPVTGRVTLRSDNPLYESWPDCDPAAIEVVGRVIWAGRRL